MLLTVKCRAYQLDPGELPKGLGAIEKALELYRKRHGEGASPKLVVLGKVHDTEANRATVRSFGAELGVASTPVGEINVLFSEERQKQDQQDQQDQ